MITKLNNQPKKGQEIEAMICWFSETNQLQQNSKYYLRHTTKEVKAIVKEVRYKVNINTLHKIEDDKVFKLNEIGRITLRTSALLCGTVITFSAARYVCPNSLRSISNTFP